MNFSISVLFDVFIFLLRFLVAFVHVLLAVLSMLGRSLRLV
jgi:hypothetical protein